jgi:hypothetical protein
MVFPDFRGKASDFRLQAQKKKPALGPLGGPCEACLPAGRLSLFLLYLKPEV